MKTRSIFSVFACTVILVIATSSWAGGNPRSRNLPNGQPDPTRQVHTNGVPGCNGYIAPIHPNLLKTMPTLACVVSQTSHLNFPCDENGNSVNGQGAKWICVKYATHNEKFIAVFQPGASGEAKILLVAANSREGWASRHEVWATGQNQAVTWMSDNASMNYASNGGDQNEVITAGRNNSPSTQVAKETPKPSQAQPHLKPEDALDIFGKALGALKGLR